MCVIVYSQSVALTVTPSGLPLLGWVCVADLGLHSNMCAVKVGFMEALRLKQ